MKKILLISFIPLIAFSFSKVATTSAAFLKIGVGRATGMGDAFVAIADDASATYWNPSGLGWLKERELLTNHVDWIGDINHNFIAFALPLKGIGTFGFDFTAVTMGRFEETKLDNPATPIREDEGTGVYFGAADIAVGISFGRLITDKLSFGLTVKAIHQGIWDMAAQGAAVSVGLLYDTGYRGLRLGTVIANFGPEISYSGRQLQFIEYDTLRTDMPLPAEFQTTPCPLPNIFRFGVAYNLIQGENNTLTIATDLVHPSDINETFNIGAEYNRNNNFFLRCGYIFNTDLDYAKDLGWDVGISAGAGVVFTISPGWLKMQMDYAYRHLGRLGPSHRAILSFTGF